MRNKKGSNIQVGITCDVFGLGLSQKLYSEIILCVACEERKCGVNLQLRGQSVRIAHAVAVMATHAHVGASISLP